jgi:hypothetical protein
MCLRPVARVVKRLDRGHSAGMRDRDFRGFVHAAGLDFVLSPEQTEGISSRLVLHILKGLWYLERAMSGIWQLRLATVSSL